MKPLIDWMIIFFLLFILHILATEFLIKLNREEMRKLDIRLEIKNRGTMYYFPVTKG